VTVGGKLSRGNSSKAREFILNIPLLLAIVATVSALAVFVFVTDAPAYAGTASSTCANCHVMDSMYENYYHARHHAEAVCADCHLPHDNVAAYYFEKGRQGMHDVYVFGTDQTPEVINISRHSQAIVQDNCVRCHRATVETIMAGVQPFARDCWECHRSVAHGSRGADLDPYQDSSLYPVEQGE
jgi:cytochrome c nitrite reductase small subunit